MTPDQSSEGVRDPSRTSIEAPDELLSTPRRRHALRYLSNNGGRAEIPEIARQVAAWERDVPPEDVERDEYHRVYGALRLYELPALADADVITFDRDADAASLSAGVERVPADDRSRLRQLEQRVDELESKLSGESRHVTERQISGLKVCDSCGAVVKRQSMSSVPCPRCDTGMLHSLRGETDEYVGGLR